MAREARRQVHPCRWVVTAGALIALTDGRVRRPAAVAQNARRIFAADACTSASADRRSAEREPFADAKWSEDSGSGMRSGPLLFYCWMMLRRFVSGDGHGAR